MEPADGSGSRDSPFAHQSLPAGREALERVKLIFDTDELQRTLDDHFQIVNLPNHRFGANWKLYERGAFLGSYATLREAKAAAGRIS